MNTLVRILIDLYLLFSNGFYTKSLITAGTKYPLFFEKKGYKDFASKLKLNSDKSSKAFRVFFKNLNNEAKETKEKSFKGFAEGRSR